MFLTQLTLLICSRPFESSFPFQHCCTKLKQTQVYMYKLSRKCIFDLSPSSQNSLDNYNKAALDLCENNDKHDWQAAAQLLRNAMSKPVSAVHAHL